MKRITLNLPKIKKRKALASIKNLKLREVVYYVTKNLDTKKETIMMSMLVTDTSLNSVVDTLKKELSLGKSLQEGVMTIDETFMACPTISEKKQETTHKGKITKMISEYSRLDKYELSFLILATIIAALGLLMNNFYIVIGAMLIAPLMNPIMSASYSFVKKNKKVLSNSLNYQVKAYFLVVILSVIIGFLLKDITNPIFSYYLDSPLMYLLLAISIGVAASLSFLSDKLIGFVGVAVSIALLPPLVIAGLAIAFGSFSQAGLSILIFLVNLAGMHLGSLFSFHFLNHKV